MKRRSAAISPYLLCVDFPQRSVVIIGVFTELAECLDNWYLTMFVYRLLLGDGAVVYGWQGRNVYDGD